MARFSRFVAVGAAGFAVQIGVLMLLTVFADWPYQLATTAAVEAAVLHNYCWHERWTWGDRTASGRELLGRIVRYQLTTGATSIVGNLLVTAAAVEILGLETILANTIAVVAMSVANFTVSDRWVFTRRPAMV